MSDNCYRTRCNCTTLAIILSALIGVVTAFLTITAVITVAPVFLWVAFGIAVAFLALIFFVTAVGFSGSRRCVCPAVTALLVGILLTILTSVILLAISFAATSIIGAIITGVLAFAFALILTVTACIIRNVTNCSED